MTTLAAFQNSLLALCVWREARNQPHDAKRGVAWVIRNRAAHPKPPYGRCPNIWSNILAPLQFSSFNRNDPNASLIPGPTDMSFVECCLAIDDPAPDNTGGATHYHSYPVGDPHWPSWATADKQTAQVGAFYFYKL